MTPVVPLTVEKDGIYVIRAGVSVTNSDKGDLNAYCAVIRSDSEQLLAGGYSPGQVQAGQTVRASFAGVDELAAGETLAVGCQTDGSVDLDDVDLLLVKLAG
jgi:hypothetical protein